MCSIDFGDGGNSSEFAVYGWSAPEPGYRWTVGTRSALCLDRFEAPHGYRLDITWSAYCPSPSLPAQPVTLTVGGRRIGSCEVGHLDRATFDCPAPAPHEFRLLIEFDHPAAARPSAMTGHHDDRMLALCLRRLVIRRHDQPPPASADQPTAGASPLRGQPTCRIVARGDAAVEEYLRGWPTPSRDQRFGSGDAAGLDVTFGVDGNAAAFTRDGWSTPEAGAVWTDGRRSRLVLPRPQPADRYTLALQLHPFTAPPRLAAQRLRLFVNGSHTIDVSVADHAIVDIEFAASLLAGQPSTELVFDLPDAARPVAFDIADGRTLGLSFKRIVFKPVCPLRAPAAVRPGPSEAMGDVPLDRLMLGFESLGENCEFGLVQRRCGAEPLGLLRFASAPLPKLLAALRARFEGMGAPENLLVEVSPNGREYMIRDLAYDLYYHAWVMVGQMTPDQILAREAKRVPFLARKLMEDLADGEKIFVYHGIHRLTHDMARNLMSFLRLYGPVVLLWVELADSGHPAGSVDWVEAGLMRGSVDRFAPPEDAHDFNIDSWVKICTSARSLSGLLIS